MVVHVGWRMERQSGNQGDLAGCNDISPIVRRSKVRPSELQGFDVRIHRGEELSTFRPVQQVVSPIPRLETSGSVGAHTLNDSDDSLETLQPNGNPASAASEGAATMAWNEDRRAGAGGGRHGEVGGSREGDARGAAGCCWNEEGRGPGVETAWRYGQRLALLQRMRAEEEYDLELQKRTEQGAVGWLWCHTMIAVSYDRCPHVNVHNWKH